MTILFGAVQGVQALKSEALARLKAKDEKHFLMSGGLYLHESAGHLQKGRVNAWKGTIEQAQNCRARHDAAAGCKLIAVDAITPQLQTVEAMQ